MRHGAVHSPTLGRLHGVFDFGGKE